MSDAQSMYLGVDLGTSGVKVVLCDSDGGLIDSESALLSVSRPKPLWSEQAPQDWWAALNTAMLQLGQRQTLTQVSAVGLTGQMHGATLIDAQGNVIRPAILWNDGRCQAQCDELESLVPNIREITGNIIMPGFTAPKVMWVREHEPAHFEQIHKVLLPKDYLRFLMTGDFASDMSDAAGTMWLDVAKRDWNIEVLEATGLTREQMPQLYEGNAITGYLSESIAEQWGMNSIPVIAGGGDNAAGALGVGIVNNGQAMLSLGTSGVYFVVGDGFYSNPESAVHSFCHALPDRWHLMSVMLSAASCLQWYSENVVKRPVAELLSELVTAEIDIASAPIFLPYLSGERTPHNNVHATGSFFNLNHESDSAVMTYAVLEGVCFGFADGIDALHAAGVSANEINVIGGGARSPFWRQLLSNIIGQPIIYREAGEVGPGLGAAKLALCAHQTQKSFGDIFDSPPIVEQHMPEARVAEIYTKRRQMFKYLYQYTTPIFS